MFGKLLKYEFKSTIKLYGLLIGGLTLGLLATGLFYISIMNYSRVLSEARSDYSSFELLPIYGLLILLIGAIIGAIYVSNLVITIRRFYQNVFGREGYLTWTLPVGPHQIILSKFIVSFTWYILSSLAIVVGIGGIMMLSGIHLEDIINFIVTYTTFRLTPLPLIVFFLSTASFILSLYFSMAIGQLFQKQRVLMSFVTAFILWVAVQSFSTMISFFVFRGGTYSQFFSYSSYSTNENNGLMISYVITIFIECLKIAALYFSTYFVTRNKLNLE